MRFRFCIKGNFFQLRKIVKNTKNKIQYLTSAHRKCEIKNNKKFNICLWIPKKKLIKLLFKIPFTQFLFEFHLVFSRCYFFAVCQCVIDSTFSFRLTCRICNGDGFFISQITLEMCVLGMCLLCQCQLRFFSTDK